MEQFLNIGKPKKRNISILFLSFVFIFLTQTPSFNRYLQNGELMTLFSPVLFILALSFIVLKTWSIEHKYSRIRTNNKTLFIRSGVSIEKFQLNDITKLKIRRFLGIYILVIKGSRPTSWYFINGFLSNEIQTLKEFIVSFNKNKNIT